MALLRRLAPALTVALMVAVSLLLLAPYSDGPLGPIPGGAMRGTLDAEGRPDWSVVPATIELQIRPQRPWSLRTYAIPVDGELYIPSFKAPHRRWVPVALADPRVVVRHHGRLYPRHLRRVDDPGLRRRLAQRMSERFGYAADGIVAAPDTWYFHLATSMEQEATR